MDIPWTDELTVLFQKLADLYPREDAATPLLDQAGINKSNLNYEGKASGERWHAIVVEAKHQDKLLNLIDAARTIYPNDETLKKMRDHFAKRKILGQQVIDTSQLNTLSTETSKRSLQFEKEVTRKPHEISKEDAELLTTQKIHWDRAYPTSVYLGMIRREQDFRILSIEASEKEDLGSLLDRYKEICKILSDQYDYPLLYARIPLAETIETGNTIAKDILIELKNATGKSNISQKDVCCEILDETKSMIDQRAAGDRNTSFTPASLASELNTCLRKITRICTIVLLISNTEMLVDSGNELKASGKWLIKNWLAEEVRVTQGLVVVVSGEKGLADLKRWQGNGVYHVPEEKLKMEIRDLVEWARKGYGLNLTEEDIKIIWESNNSIAKFRNYLETTKKILQRGAINLVDK